MSKDYSWSITPCKAFGHTQGRKKSGSCRTCESIRSVIRISMWYWGNRLILGLSGSCSTPYYTADDIRAHARKSMRRFRNRKDQALITEILEAKPWLKELL